MSAARIELERLIHRAISATMDGTTDAAVDATNATRAVMRLFARVEEYWNEADTTSYRDLDGQSRIDTRVLQCSVPRESIPFRRVPDRTYGLEDA